MGCFSTKDVKGIQTETEDAPPHRNTVSNFISTTIGKLTDKYEIIEFLGEGTFGRVREVREFETGLLRAVKSIPMEGIKPEYISTILEEVNMLKSLDHPGIIKIFQVCEDSKYIHIITELCTGGELFDRILKCKYFSENIAARYMFDIVSTIKYLHEAGIVHRDLKPDNILFEDSSETSRLKIIDFGTSTKVAKDQMLKKLIGTPFYLAPEVIKGNYNKQCDVWSVGVSMYIMLCGKPPFGGNNNQEIYDNIVNAKPSFAGKVWAGVSKAAKSLVKRALQKEPRLRISISDMFYDPWLRTRAEGLVPEKLMAGRMLNRLADFKNVNKLRTCTFSFLAHCLATANDLKHVRVLFENLDENGDGRLSREELQKGFKEYCGDHLSNMEDIIAQCDIDGNGYIDYSEFLTCVVSNSIEISKANLQIAFNALDKDGSGTISRGELQDALEALTDKQTIDKIMRDIDLNDDGEIDIEEFTTCILNSAIT